ncbi:MAG: hypothetical protein U1F83_00915 [Verrucomicrobiota bacterium]
MSLKAVHLIFVSALLSLCFGAGAWKFRQYRQEQAATDLVWAIVAMLLGVAVIVYGRYFLKKLKHLNYL